MAINPFLSVLVTKAAFSKFKGLPASLGTTRWSMPGTRPAARKRAAISACFNGIPFLLYTTLASAYARCHTCHKALLVGSAANTLCLDCFARIHTCFLHSNLKIPVGKSWIGWSSPHFMHSLVSVVIAVMLLQAWVHRYTAPYIHKLCGQLFFLH